MQEARFPRTSAFSRVTLRPAIEAFAFTPRDLATDVRSETSSSSQATIYVALRGGPQVMRTRLVIDLE